MGNEHQKTLLNAEIAKRLHEQFALHNYQYAKDMVAAMEKIIQEALVSGREVKLGSFGSLRTKVCKPRVGRSPQSGELISIPEKNTVVFKPYSGLLDALNPKP